MNHERMPSDEQIYEQHYADLVSFARSMVGSSEAQDVASAAVVAAFMSEGWRLVANPRAYLFTATYHESLRVLKRRNQRRVLERRAHEVRDIELPALHPEVADAVRDLSTQQRAVIVLTYWQDLGVTEVAEYMGITDGAVRKHLARARANLRKVLNV